MQRQWDIGREVMHTGANRKNGGVGRRCSARQRKSPGKEHVKHGGEEMGAVKGKLTVKRKCRERE